jgi:hypothetical protein
VARIGMLLFQGCHNWRTGPANKEYHTSPCKLAPSGDGSMPSAGTWVRVTTLQVIKQSACCVWGACVRLADEHPVCDGYQFVVHQD